MPLLTDAQLAAALLKDPRIFEGLDVSDLGRSNSHIQPCSVDLHIGEIYLPGESGTGVGGSLRPRTELSLGTGQTAVLVTKEHLNLPRDWAAYGFPPSHISAGGLLMTNPGHLDPGYVGKLRFTVINMSGAPVALRRSDAIVTIIVHQLETAVDKDFQERRSAAGLGSLPDPSWDDVNRLAKDFVDVEARSKKIASEEVREAVEKLNKLDTRTKFTTAIIGAIALLIGAVGTLLVGWLTGMQTIRNDVSDIKSKVDVVELKKDLSTLSSEVAKLSSKVVALEKRK